MIGTRTTSAAGAALLAFAALAAPAAAQDDYPAKSIELTVPSPPGGGTDTFARVLAGLMEKDLGRQVVVENRPGGGGTLGVARLVKAKPDGHTVGFIWNSPLTTAPLSLQVPFTPDDYRPVLSIGYSSYVMCVAPDFPASDAKGFVEELRKNPAKYTYGNDGVGGTMQLAAERVFQRLGVQARGVPFGGAGETARNFLGGHVDIYGGSLPPILPHVKANRAKCLLLTSAADNPAVPGAQGLDALGIGDAETVLWWGAILPARTPDAVADRLYGAFAKATGTDEFKQAMAGQGATVRLLDGRATVDLISEESEALGAVAASLGIAKAAN